MQASAPSRTAMGAARLRAAHQLEDGGAIFADPLAVRILGEAAGVVDANEHHRVRRGLRLFIACRSRFAEDALASAIEHGVRQVVILGAGLDTYAYRAPLDRVCRVFEVDHPATQAWKWQRLAAAGIAVPGKLAFVPVDFEREALGDALRGAGFDSAQATFFTWLGVVPYLGEDAIFATLGFIAGLAGGAHVVFDYANPPDTLTRAAHEALAKRVARAGEPLRTCFATDALRERLAALGFRDIEDLGPAQIAARFFSTRLAEGSRGGGHILRAATSGR